MELGNEKSQVGNDKRKIDSDKCSNQKNGKLRIGNEKNY